jgi:hypothetical protein
MWCYCLITYFCHNLVYFMFRIIFSLLFQLCFVNRCFRFRIISCFSPYSPRTLIIQFTFFICWVIMQCLIAFAFSPVAQRVKGRSLAGNRSLLITSRCSTDRFRFWTRYVKTSRFMFFSIKRKKRKENETSVSSGKYHSILNSLRWYYSIV